MIILCQQISNSTLPGIDWSFLSQLATVIYTVLTCLLLLAAWQGVKHNNDLRNADFAHRFKGDFFNPLTQEIFCLFTKSDVTFIPKNNDGISMSYFKIGSYGFEKDYLENKLERKIKDKILVEEVSNSILDHFEDLSVWVEKKIISMDYVKMGYGDYIIKLAEHPAIIAFLLSGSPTNSLKDLNFYGGFYSLYEQIKQQNSVTTVGWGPWALLR